MIATEKLGKRYGEKTVLSGVTLELPKEKIIAFIGGNGTGKSTLLSLITRTLSKSEGKVMVDGTELSDWNNRELAKKLSILRQANDLNIRLTIRELVAFGRFPYTRGRLNAEDEKRSTGHSIISDSNRSNTAILTNCPAASGKWRSSP